MVIPFPEAKKNNHLAVMQHGLVGGDTGGWNDAGFVNASLNRPHIQSSMDMGSTNEEKDMGSGMALQDLGGICMYCLSCCTYTHLRRDLHLVLVTA